jgi:hypothetical protein
MMYGVEAWGLGSGKENDNIQGRFFLMKELRMPGCAANKLMNTNSKGKAEK